MGSAISPASGKDAGKHIEDDIHKQAMMEKGTQKLLLLGPGESGKSTVLKQIRNLAHANYTPDEIFAMTSSIYSNVLQSTKELLQGMQKLNIPFENADCESDRAVYENFVRTYGEFNQFTQPLIAALKRMWCDTGMQTCFHRSDEFHFLDDIDRIGHPMYTPTSEDLLRIRVQTTGIVEIKFTLKNTLFRVVDVGGQRTERKKWIHCFEGINAIIFLAALSEYNQVLREDGQTNRMAESIQLFGTICNSTWFASTSIIVFLNKKDLFMEKLRSWPITVAFPDYDGPNTYDATSAFIEKQFRSAGRPDARNVYFHQTCATDTNQIQLVLDTCITTIVSKNIGNAGII